MMPYAFSTSDSVYVTVVVTGFVPDITVALKTPVMPKKDWHAMVFIKGTSYEVSRAVNDAYLPENNLLGDVGFSRLRSGTHVGQQVSTPAGLEDCPGGLRTAV
jgi:hypothetical protein